MKPNYIINNFKVVGTVIMWLLILAIPLLGFLLIDYEDILNPFNNSNELVKCVYVIIMSIIYTALFIKL